MSTHVICGHLCLRLVCCGLKLICKTRDFLDISGGGEALFRASVVAYPESMEIFNKLTEEKHDFLEVLHQWEWFIEGIINNSHSHSTSTHVMDSLAYVANMTEYINILKEVEDVTTEELIKKIDARLNESWRLCLIGILVVSSAGIICPPLIAWNVYDTRKMQKKIQEFTKGLARQAAALKHEKQKTDMILYQMLPVSIANDLKANKAVEPEYFEMATLFFSDIMGFTALSGHSTPIQIITLLNKLYTSCDGILDKYDVYKVETIGDGYMVVSGLPRRNGHQHSSEICTMALDIMQMIEQFEIPHLPGQKLLMRIGIHTGPCAAGIVGTKMPRYCLFGDTVNTASRIESHGLGMRIHLSDATRGHLNAHHRKFELVTRGKVSMKSKGELITFWLVGKENFAYRVDLAETERQVEASTYWKEIVD